MAVIATLCILALLGLTAAVSGNYTRQFDEQLLTTIHHFNTPALDTLFSSLTRLGEPAVAIAFGLIYFAIFIRKQPKITALIAPAISLGSVLITSFLKIVFDRTRPELWQAIVTESSYSFPSGHAAASLSIALILFLHFSTSKYRLLITVIGTIYVLLVGLSRVYLGVHYPTDVVGGWLVTASWAALLLFATNRIGSSSNCRQ